MYDSSDTLSLFCSWSNQHSDANECYSDILVDTKKQKFTPANQLVDNDLYGS